MISLLYFQELIPHPSLKVRTGEAIHCNLLWLPKPRDRHKRIFSRHFETIKARAMVIMRVFSQSCHFHEGDSSDNEQTK